MSEEPSPSVTDTTAHPPKPRRFRGKDKARRVRTVPHSHNFIANLGEYGIKGGPGRGKSKLPEVEAEYRKLLALQAEVDALVLAGNRVKNKHSVHYVWRLAHALSRMHKQSGRYVLAELLAQIPSAASRKTAS